MCRLVKSHDVLGNINENSNIPAEYRDHHPTLKKRCYRVAGKESNQ